MDISLLENPKLARIVADLTGDGHLQIKQWRHLISFYSKNIEEIEAFRQRFKELFQLEGKLYVHNHNTKNGETTIYKLFFSSKPVALYLQEIGTPVGNKTNISFEIPPFVINGSEEVKSSYLQGLFDCEGSIFCRGNNRWQISLKMAKNESILSSGVNYLNQIRKLLSDFEINSSPVKSFFLNIRKNGSKSYYNQFDIESNYFMCYPETISLR
jgi:intein/homing endonuclease